MSPEPPLNFNNGWDNPGQFSYIHNDVGGLRDVHSTIVGGDYP
jgi:hypothetical protein